jgi:uncharacterized small protein (TIGR04563 family)
VRGDRLNARFANFRRSGRGTVLALLPGVSVKTKQSLYMESQVWEEIEREAQRLERSSSWIVQAAWAVARERLRAFPGSESPPEPVSPPAAEAAPASEPEPTRVARARR